VSASVASQPYAGLVRLGALASTVSGALRIASTFIPYQPGSATLEALYVVIDLGLMFGLVAAYLAYADRIGAAGLAAFAIGLAGIASIVGPDAVLFDIDFYRIGALTFVGGLALLSAVMLRAGVMRVAAGLWLATFLASLTASVWPPAFMAAGVLLGSGYVVAGVSLLGRGDPRVSPQPG
jgi:hypothetical protein